jgi:hypothetical protein
MIKRLLLTFVALSSIFSTYSNAQYCTAQGSDCGFDFISRVTIGEVMDNDTECNFYGDYTQSHVVSMDLGAANPITVFWNSDGTTANYLVAVWIDWNQNGDFTDVGDEVIMTNSNLAQHAGTITVPADAVPGGTRMRIRMVQNDAPVSCGTQSRGEVEDYTIFVIDPAGGNIAPIANDDQAETPFNDSVEIDILANDNDPDGDLVASSINFVEAARNGVLTVDDATAKVMYKPRRGFVGTDTFIYNLGDAAGDTSNNAMVKIRVFVVGNAPPVANRDFAETAVGQSVEIDLLANDEDFEENFDTAGISILVAVSNGSINLDEASGVATYAPNAAFEGLDSFQYKVCDIDDFESYCDSAWAVINVGEPVGPTGINTATIGNLVISPNPASGLFTISTDGMKSGTLSIFDMSGKRIFVEQITNNTTLNAQHLPSGIFNVVLQNETMISRSKLIVQ